MRSSLRRFGETISDNGARLAGHPFAQIILLTVVIGWVGLGGSANAAMLALAVLAITLTQMVLNQQRRRDSALHIKIDELIVAMGGARDELAGIETKSEQELDALRRKEEDAPPPDGDRGA